MQYELPIYVIIFLYGIVIGSFLNVLIYRLPLKENIATESSHCMSCGHKLQWYDLVPLVSYMILGGRCRYCKTKISPQYPVIEGINGAMYVIIFLVNGLNIISGLMCLVFSMFLVITVIDERTQEIPFALNVVIGVLGIIRILFDREHLLDYLIGLFLCKHIYVAASYYRKSHKGSRCIWRRRHQAYGSSRTVCGMEKCYIGNFCLAASLVR